MKDIFEDGFMGSPYDGPDTTRKYSVGHIARTRGGKIFRYCRTDADFTQGFMMEATSNDQAIAATYFGVDTSTAPTATEGGAVGDEKIRYCVTSGITAGEFVGGLLIISDGTGESYEYSVLAIEASAASGGALITIPYPGLRVALDNTSVGVLVNSPYWDVNIVTQENWGDMSGATLQKVVGRAMFTSTAATDSNTQFGWVQARGWALLKAGAATMIAGAVVVPAEDVDGVVQVGVDAEPNVPRIGFAMSDVADTVWGMVFLTCE